MKIQVIALSAVLGFAHAGRAQDVTIQAFSHNGQLTWTAPSDSDCTIEWASSLTPTADWRTSWIELQNIRSTNTTTTAAVPMFYRVTCWTNGLFARMPVGRTYVYAASNALGQTWTQEWTCAGLATVPSMSNSYVLMETRDITGNGRPDGSLGNRKLLLRSTDRLLTSYQQSGCEITESQHAPPITSWTSYLPDGAIQENTIWTNQTVYVPAGDFEECVAVYRVEMAHPSDRIAHALAYAESTGKVLLFGGWGPTADTWEYDVSGGAWKNQKIAGAKPPARQWHAMASSGGSKIVMFGGDAGEYPIRNCLDDTWEYDAATHTWTEIIIAGPKPAARSEHAMAYGGGTRVVMFGGTGAAEDNLNDTWVYDSGTHAWSLVNPIGTTPSTRSGHAMADAGNSCIVMFGGIHDGTILSDTWQYDALSQTWTNIITSTTPPERWQHAMSYSGNSEVLMFGGMEEYNPPTRINRDDTWVYNATTHVWTDYNTSGLKPAPRHLHRMASLGGNRVLLFAGEATLGPGVDDWDQVSDTWEYDMDGHTWKQVVTSTACHHPRQEWVEWWKPGFFLVKWIDLQTVATNTVPVFYQLQTWRDD